MAQKVPSVFSCDPKIAERMFLSLPVEPAGVRAQVQESISVMATAYKESGFKERDEIESLLVRSFESSEVRSTMHTCNEVYFSRAQNQKTQIAGIL